MTSTRGSTLENSAETQFAARSNSVPPSAACKKRKGNSSTDPSIGSAGADHGVKNKRTRYTAYQVETLKKIFESTQYPDFEELETIARDLVLEKDVVKVWFKNRRARQKTQEQEHASRIFLQRRRSSLPPQFPIPTPVYYYPMCPVVPSPWQPMTNYHGNTAGLYDRPMNNVNLYHNGYNVVHSQEPRSDAPVSCYRGDDLTPYSSY